MQCDNNQISEPGIILYQFVGAFFEIRDGVKMLKIGLQFGGKDQLVFVNYDDPGIWTDRARMQATIDALSLNGYVINLVDDFGPHGAGWQAYAGKVTAERLAGGDQLVQYWVEHHELPKGADRTVFGSRTFPLR
jgi:hypothetical protein